MFQKDYFDCYMEGELEPKRDWQREDRLGKDNHTHGKGGSAWPHKWPQGMDTVNRGKINKTQQATGGGV